MRAGVEDLERGVEAGRGAARVDRSRAITRRRGRRSARFDSPELKLYERFAAEDADAAHSRYNALVRRLVSFERAAECAS